MKNFTLSDITRSLAALMLREYAVLRLIEHRRLHNITDSLMMGYA
jgi:hypothetical protein